jgi:hypothetical protein
MTSQPQPQDEERDYIASVDALWYTLHHRQLNSLDFANVEALFEAGVPIQAVTAGIRRATASHRKAHPRQGIHGVTYCFPAIMEEWENMAPELVWRDPDGQPLERSPHP